MRYYYGMRLRGYSPMCQPSGAIEVQDDESGKYYDVIVYDRELSKQEVLAYELDFIKAEKEEVETAEEVEDAEMMNWNEMSAGEIVDAVEEAWDKVPEDVRSYIELDWKMRQAELLVRGLDIVTAVSEYIDAVGWDGELTEDDFKSILLD